LQGTQNPPHKANLAKELQLPTHGRQFFISGRQKTKEKEKKNRLRRFRFASPFLNDNFSNK